MRLIQVLRRWWQGEQAAGAYAGLSREQLLVICFGMVGVNSLVFYFLPQPHYDPRANLLAAMVLLGLLPFAMSPRWHHLMANVGLLVVVALVGHVAIKTGGIHSPTLVFLTVLAVPALFFLGPVGAGAWLLVVLTLYVCLLLASLQMDGLRPIAPQGMVIWAWGNHVLAAASLLWVLRLYERNHRKQWAEVQARNQALERMQAQLLAAQAHKDDFVAAVGHELRTPMNAILGLNGVLCEELADDPLNAQTAQHIRHSTEHLLRVVNDILDFAQLQAGRVLFFPQSCALAPWLTQTLQPYQVRAQAKGLDWQVRLSAQLPPQVVIDAQRLGQILGYLLDNAIKFTASGHIWLAMQVKDERLCVQVQDSGRGVAAERQKQIFNRFESADISTAQAFGGTGLGLSICERLVVLQGGRIGVDSAVGQGSVFWLELPLQIAPQRTETPERSVRVLDCQAVFDVLVVDDNAMNLMVAQLQLRKQWPQARVITASSGLEALAVIQTQHLDVALIDMVMPDMDGLAVTRHLRQLPLPWRDLPVVALTANANPVDRQRCLDAGMNRVLYKPMDPGLLVGTLSELLAHKQEPA